MAESLIQRMGVPMKTIICISILFLASPWFDAIVLGQSQEQPDSFWDQVGQLVDPSDLLTQSYGFAKTGAFEAADTSHSNMFAADSFQLFRGFQIGGDLFDSFIDDNSYMRFNPGFTLCCCEAPVWLIFESHLGFGVSQLQTEIESNGLSPGLTMWVESWNEKNYQYEFIGTATESLYFDSVKTFEGIAADHVDQDGMVRCRVGWTRTGLTINYPWEVRLDRMNWRAEIR